MSELFILFGLMPFIGIGLIVLLVVFILFRPSPFTLLRMLWQIIGVTSVFAMLVPLGRILTSESVSQAEGETPLIRLLNADAINQADATMFMVCVGVFILSCVLAIVCILLDKRFYGSVEEKEQSCL